MASIPRNGSITARSSPLAVAPIPLTLIFNFLRRTPASGGFANAAKDFMVDRVYIINSTTSGTNISCIGSLIIKKTLTDDTPIPLPASTLFPMTVTCGPPPTAPVATFSLNANGSYTVNNIPLGSTCTVAEIPPALPANLCPAPTVPMWVPPLPTYTPSSVVISGTPATITVHNSVQCEPPKRDGTLSVTKVVSPDPLNIGTTKPFPMTVACTPSPPAPPSYTVVVNGNTSTAPINVPVGSQCSTTEGAMPPLPPGCHCLAPAYSPASVTIASGLNQEIVTNGYTCRGAGGPIDLKIDKTGGTTPYCPAPYYDFTITVTNTGAGWPGTGNITMTDTVPANMTFGPITTPGWSCPAGVIPAGTTFTCTYTGPAPTANQVLPVITIPATPLVGPPFPPFTNCASVAIASSSGYVDSNSANNNSCTTVSKPSSCNSCPPPQVMNIDGICVNPPPICTAPQVPNADGICACPAPMQPGAVPGTCICPLPNVMVNGVCVPPPPVCPQGQVLVGGACVPTSPVCPAPQVPNVDGICVCPAPMQPGAVPGQCLCPNGTAPVGGACVTPPVRKQPEKKKRTERDCPEGTTKQGSKWVKRESNGPRITPSGIIRGLGGGGGGGVNPGGGGAIGKH